MIFVKKVRRKTLGKKNVLTDFINEQDAGTALPGHGEHVTNTGRTHTDEHLKTQSYFVEKIKFLIEVVESSLTPPLTKLTHPQNG